MNIERFDDTSFSQLRKDLLRKKGSAKQRQFLKLLRDREKFCQYLDNVDVEPGRGVPLLKQTLSAENYREMSIDVEKQIFQSWQKITPADACSPSFWGLVTFRHIQEGIIEPHFLAAYSGNTPATREQILHISDRGTDKEVHGMIQSALRSFYGLKEEGGNRTVYVHCIFARAWWRVYLCNEVCKQTGADPDKVIEVFRKSSTYWRRLILLTVSRNSVLGDMKVRDALVWTLSELIRKEEYAHIFNSGVLDKIGRLIGMRSAWQELGVFSMEELKEMMETEFIAVML